MDKIDKALKRLSGSEYRRAISLIEKITTNQLSGLNITKLKDRKDVFRVRTGDLRIIYFVIDGRNKVTDIAHRSEKTYRNI